MINREFWLLLDKLVAVICIVDITKRDSEIKVLIGCTREEVEIVYDTHNATDCMKGLLILRNEC